jgi:hypothetical protein
VAVPHALEAAFQAKGRLALLLGLPTVADAPSPGGRLHADFPQPPGS